MTDLVMEKENNFYDFVIDDNGDLKSENCFNTAILYALLGERRASESEVTRPELRRGWIGNEGKDFENGSKLWLYEQARITRTVLNEIQTVISSALRFFIDDGLLADVIVEQPVLNNGGIGVNVTLERFNGITESKFYEFWDCTGN